MITHKVNPIARTVELQYPTFAKIKPVVIPVRNYDEASAVVRIRTLKFISNEIRSFINMRNYAYSYGNRMTQDRQKALNHIRFILDSYSEGSIERLAMHLANSRISFAELMPVKQSPAKTHFNNHIVPIIKYCTDLSEQSLKN